MLCGENVKGESHASNRRGKDVEFLLTNLKVKPPDIRKSDR